MGNLLVTGSVFFSPRASERRVLPIVGVCISSSHLHTFSSSHLLIFTSSHLHTFSSSHLHICASSHLLIFTSAHLHIFSSSHLLIFTSAHLHICSSSHLLIFTSSHLHICSSSHLLIFTSSHTHIFSFSLSHSHLHILTSSLSLSLSPLSSPLSCFDFVSIDMFWQHFIDARRIDPWRHSWWPWPATSVQEMPEHKIAQGPWGIHHGTGRRTGSCESLDRLDHVRPTKNGDSTIKNRDFSSEQWA